MSHREREIVTDRGTSERKGMLSLKFLASVWNTKCAVISRAAESALQSVTRRTLLDTWPICHQVLTHNVQSHPGLARSCRGADDRVDAL